MYVQLYIFSLHSHIIIDMAISPVTVSLCVGEINNNE